MKKSHIPQEIQKKFLEILNSGNEEKVRQFLLERMKELPENVQDSLITGLVEEALEKNNLDRDFKERGLAALNALGNAKEEIERHLELKEIKKSIG